MERLEGRLKKTLFPENVQVRIQLYYITLFAKNQANKLLDRVVD